MKSTLHIFLPNGDRVIYTSDEYNWKFVGSLVIHVRKNNHPEQQVSYLGVSGVVHQEEETE